VRRILPPPAGAEALHCAGRRFVRGSADMRCLPEMALGLVAVVAAAGSFAAAAGPFSEQTVDPVHSGDDKAVADLDGDGDFDGILGGDSLAWYRSAGLAREFTRFEIRPAPIFSEFTTDMAVADLDADGDTDLVIADGNGAGNVLWFENPRLDPPPGTDPDPTVGENWLHHTIGTHGSWAHDMFVGDVDDDGLLDVVTGGNGFLHVHFRQAGGGWLDRDLTALAGSGGAPADIDGDSDLDLFVPDGWLEAPALPRTGVWTFHPIDDSNPGDGPALVGVDLNDDRRPDLVTAPQHVAGSLAWFENPPDPIEDPWIRREIDDDIGSHHLLAADFDLDGRLDLLAGLELTEIAVYFQQPVSPPTFVEQLVFDDSGHNAVIGDLDGDGDPDIWACDWIGHPPVRAFWNEGTTIFTDGFESGTTEAWDQAVP
ncbi:MAG: VCBS repeat-containing protein, partial [Chloroflexi bacterium]|nr:VCBS repeat-containing protein [Chloroflexota bacterium]